MAADPSAQVLTLAGGRRLGFAEWGDPAGRPVLYFHGGPGCRLDVWGVAEAERTGVRIVTFDRPGIGLSDPRPGRRLTDWPPDAVAVADHLGLERFGVIGLSMGGPHAAVTAWALPDRVSRAAIVSAIWFMDEERSFREHGKRAYWRLCRRSPDAMRGVWALLAATGARAPGLAAQLFAASCTRSERAVLARPEVRDTGIVMMAEALGGGARGTVEDMLSLMRPRGFCLEDIRVPVDVWQGDDDSFCPPAWGRRYATRIPGATLHACPGEGHFLIADRIGEILAAVASA